MRVGITAHFQFSMFSGGGASTVIALAELLKLMGHDVTLVNLNGAQDWWDDMGTLKQLFPRVNVSQVETPFDLLFEVANPVNDKETRQRIAKQSIWVIRKPILLQDVECSIFPISMSKRNLEGLTAVWCLDQEVVEDELQYLETLTRVPVRKVPFVWSPLLVELYRKETGHPSWIQVAVAMTQQQKKVLPWSVHICETNNSASSSCTIPLVVLREAKLQKQFPFQTYKLHNAQPVENSEFFKQNVFAHCQVEDVSGQMIGRQRVVDFALDPMSCIVAHLRFRRLRPYLLEAIWSGIPMVHNSPFLKSLGCGYEDYFYEDNSISGAVKALNQLHTDLAHGKGMFSQGNHMAIQQALLERISPVSPKVQAGWREAIASLPVSVATPSVPSAPPSSEAPVLRILFTDMWDEFHSDYNMFLLMLQEASKGLTPKPRIEGYTRSTLPSGITPNLLLFGPFGDEWKSPQWASVPKVHFTGENSPPVLAEGVVLNLGYPHADFVDERYIRLPLWMLEIDWFGANPDRIVNPKPLPLDRCTKVYPEEIQKKQKFCAFVVTNPCNPVRNNAFHWLSQYKQVDSAGRLFNNVGDAIFAGLGGGGGELKKHEFLKHYKFCLAYENASSQGYTTEKLLHAKAAGCIPIYWGDPKVERDFDTKGFVDARRFSTPEELVEAVRKIDTDPTAYLQMLSVPALDEYKRDLVRRTFSQIAFAMLKAGLPQLGLKPEMIPRFLGATSSEEAAALRRQREQTDGPAAVPVPMRPTGSIVVRNTPKNPAHTLREDPVFVTMATLRFLPSLQQLITGLQAQKRLLKDLNCVVYIGSDVSDEVLESLKTAFAFVTFRRLPTETPPEFPDYWAPEHFAWKLWIYNEIAHDATFKGRLICYMDSGIFLSRIPKAWFQIVEEEGICAFDDAEQTNGSWCHEEFRKALAVTEDELNSHQIIAGCLAFVNGNEKATRLFEEAYTWSKSRAVITGPKWAGVKDGKPFGHRHDQSILSILTQRMGIVRYPLSEVYCDHSLRKTFLTGKCFYVHRGAFTLHTPFLPEIDDAFVINLDRRKDRMEKLYSHNPELKNRITRLSAYEGKSIQLTPAIARLFKPHDFFWKKPILGCALSHLELWCQLVHERPEINRYLIMEDDVKLKPGWEETWKAAAGYIPEDADIVYLGGILPPNRMGFERVKERVNDYFSRVAVNDFFGQNPPNRYFHWCNYAYILTRKGAETILKIMMERDGYWTSADHMVCNRVDRLNHYFIDPLVAGCYQDDDPRYQSSQFNDFSRIDAFDSDLWNNDERFTPQEVEDALKRNEGKAIDIEKALADAKQPRAAPHVAQAPVVETTIGAEPVPVAAKKAVSLLQPPPTPPKRRLVCLAEHKFDSVNAYEREWIQELLGKETPFRVETLSFDDPAPTDAPLVIVQRPHVDRYRALFQKWTAQGASFSVLHLSDEYAQDSLDFYTLPSCLAIVRMYQRSDVPTSVKEKVVTIPLGYHWTLAGGSDNPIDKTPRLPFRNVKWSFYGTGWQDRAKKLEPLRVIGPNSLRLVTTWESEEKLTREQYVASLLDSVFVPCPPGNNPETFRLYEALECGCIPLYVKSPGDDTYVEWLQTELGLLPVSTWEEAAALMLHFMREKELLEGYRNSLLLRWKTWKQRLGSDVRKLLAIE